MTRLQWQGFALMGAVLLSLLINRQLLGEQEQAVVPAPPATGASITARQPAAVSPRAETTVKPELASASIVVSAHPAPRALAPPQVAVTSAFVSEIGNPYPLFAQEPLQRWPLASLTKLMTALVAVETMDGEREVTIAETDVAAEGASGAFATGERFTVSDLITAMLSASSNDAAEAVARTYGRSAFLSAMNETAARLSLSRTRFSDPTGLSVLNQTTAADVARLVDFIARTHPELLAITRQKTVTITERARGMTRTLVATHQFAGDPNFIGGKTGYTEEAAGNLVSVFRTGGRDIIIVVLGTTDRFAQTKLLLSWAKSISY